VQIHVRSKQVEMDEAVRIHIEHRLEQSLGRHAARIRRVSALIVDVNGPRGGEDKVCRLEIRLLPTGSLFVEDTDADLYAAVSRAAERAARAVTRAVERTRESGRATVSRNRVLPVPTPADTDEEPAA
jgi:putative sigma-54 modulation protein